jgi:hypothetical protein
MKRKQLDSDEEFAELNQKIQLLSTENSKLKKQLHQNFPTNNFEGFSYICKCLL